MPNILDADKLRTYLLRKKIYDFLFDNLFLYRVIRECLSIFSALKKKTIPNRKREYRNYYVLDANPIIVMTMESMVDLEFFSEIVGQRPAYFLKLFPWTKESFVEMYQDFVFYKQHQKKYPRHKIFFLCNTRLEKKLADFFDIPAIWCNHNCFLDERIYIPRENSQKQFDIIYNARLDPAKRHYLLAQLPSIALILGPNVNISDEIRKYKQAIRTILPDAVIANDPALIKLSECQSDDFDFPLLPSSDVVSVVNQSYVGVILSREEGACYASAEYLLCGLPVVSTKNLGGRDVFLLDEPFVKFVRSQPGKIKDAVEELKHLKISSHEIRESTLFKIRQHRERFQVLVQQIYNESGRSDFDVKRNWDKIFINKMIVFGQKWPDSFIEALRR